MLSLYISSSKTYSFLTGAGISYDSPSNLPLAKDIVYRLIDVLSVDLDIKDQIKNQFDDRSLRFEQFMELITEIFDPNLHILDQLSMCNSPNLIHNLLAEFIRSNHFVFTTNFDCLIEKACMQKGISVRTVYSNKQNLCDGTKAVWKLHGSLQDENGQDTRNSIVATLSRLGQKGEAFSSDPFLRRVFVSNISQHDLIVLGYSGSDDYDIVPMISQINTQNRIYWIWHDQEIPYMKVFGYSTFKKEYKNAPETFNKLFSLGNWEEDQIYVVVGRTSEILSEIAKILIKNIDINHCEDEYKIPHYYYLQWSLKYTLEEWRRLSFLGKYFCIVGNYEEAHRYFLLALSKAEEAKEIFPIIYALNCLSRTCIKDNKPQLAMEYLEEMHSLLDESQESLYSQLEQKMLRCESGFMIEYNQHLAICYSEMGDLEGALEILHKAKPQKGTIEYARGLYEEARIMRKMGDLPKAFSLVEEAISIHRKHGNLESLAICLPFLSAILIEKNEFSRVEECLNEIISICKIINDFKLMFECQHLLGQIKNYNR